MESTSSRRRVIIIGGGAMLAAALSAAVAGQLHDRGIDIVAVDEIPADVSENDTLVVGPGGSRVRHLDDILIVDERPSLKSFNVSEFYPCDYYDRWETDPAMFTVLFDDRAPLRPQATEALGFKLSSEQANGRRAHVVGTCKLW